MPRVVISYNPEFYEYDITQVPKDYSSESEYEVTVEMKASHFRNMRRNMARVDKDQEFLTGLFIQAQSSGRKIREQ